jgi:hypothetical protein
MKRLSWLLAALLCTVFVQVQPVETAGSCPCSCCPCKVPGACGVPCSGAPAPAPVVFAAEQQARAARPAGQWKVQAARPAEKFFARYVEPAAAPFAHRAPGLLALAAEVPLFKAHCCFLI